MCICVVRAASIELCEVPNLPRCSDLVVEDCRGVAELCFCMFRALTCAVTQPVSVVCLYVSRVVVEHPRCERCLVANDDAAFFFLLLLFVCRSVSTLNITNKCLCPSIVSCFPTNRSLHSLWLLTTHLTWALMGEFHCEQL